MGTTLAGYRIEALLGQGGMGVVYRAHDEALERSVALKLINPALASDSDFRDRFLVEARLAASLDHPNVIPVYDAGDIDGQLYLAMRYVEGTDLRELLAQQERLQPERALAICGQVAQALDAAHRKVLVHQDVKPSNVLLDEDGHAYLADFGLTRRLADQAPGFQAGLSLGTPAYVPPEQIRGTEVDGRADQYALACVLYECLSGERPYEQSSELATLYAHLEHEPPAYPGLEVVFTRALAKDADDRYESCTAFVEAARAALLGPRRRRLIAGAAAAVVVLAAAAAAAVLAFTGEDGPAVGHHWTRVPHAEAIFGGSLGTGANDVTSGPGGLVAAGETGEWDRDAESDLAVWTSLDGVTWARSTDPSLSVPGYQHGTAVSADGSGYTVVGSAAAPAEDVADLVYDAAVWRSSDGRSWRRIRSDSFGGSLGQSMLGVAAWPGGLVASGIDITDDSTSDDIDAAAAIWTSPDGEIWRRVEPRDPRLFAPSDDAPSPRWVWPFGIAASDTGTIVAVAVSGGGDDDVPGGTFGVIWVSKDGGETWARVPHEDALFGDADFTSRVDSGLEDVAVGDAGFVAIGSDFDGDPGVPVSAFTSKPRWVRSLVLTSQDGLHWNRVPNAQLPDRGLKVNLETITYGSGGYVAAGWRVNNLGVADADLDPVVWLSRDGNTWNEAADPTDAFDQPGGQVIADVTWHGDRLVAVGFDGDTKTHNAAIWTSP